MSIPPPPLPSPALPEEGDWAAAAEWAAAQGHLSLALRAPAWPRPDAAAPPLVVIGHDYTGPAHPVAEPAIDLPAPDAAADWTAGLPPDDPFARLLAGLARGAPDGIWLG